MGCLQIQVVLHDAVQICNNLIIMRNSTNIKKILKRKLNLIVYKVPADTCYLMKNKKLPCLGLL